MLIKILIEYSYLFIYIVYMPRKSIMSKQSCTASSNNSVLNLLVHLGIDHEEKPNVPSNDAGSSINGRKFRALYAKDSYSGKLIAE